MTNILQFFFKSPKIGPLIFTPTQKGQVLMICNKCWQRNEGVLNRYEDIKLLTFFQGKILRVLIEHLNQCWACISILIYQLNKGT